VDYRYGRRSKQCIDPYGRECPYINLCTSDCAMWPSLFPHFKIEEVHPFNPETYKVKKDKEDKKGT